MENQQSIGNLHFEWIKEHIWLIDVFVFLEISSFFFLLLLISAKTDFKFIFYLFICLFLDVLCSMQDLSSWIRDGTSSLCRESSDS